MTFWLHNTCVQLGQKCGDSGAELLDDRQIPLNNYNLVMTDGDLTSPKTNRVGIGTIGCTPNAKLEVIRHFESSAYEYENKAIAGINEDMAANNGYGIGVFGEANNTENYFNIGGDFIAKLSRKNTIGVRGKAEGSQTNFGGCI